MQKHKPQRLYFLREDISALYQMIEELRTKLKQLGIDQGEAAGQSTENMGHDDAVQETIVADRQITVTRLKELSNILNRAQIVEPKARFDEVRFGAVIELSNGQKFRIGSYQIFADHPIKTISYQSPIAKSVIGKKLGDEVNFRGQISTIVLIR